MDDNTKELCSILTERVRSIIGDRMTTESEHELRCTMDKMKAVLDGDLLAFHLAAERELQRKDEQVANEYSACEYLSNGLRRLRRKNLENVLQIDLLKNEIAELKKQNEMHREVDQSGIAFQMPFGEVKKYLSYMDYYPDSIIDPEQTEAMKEYGWRRLLQKYVDHIGNLPANH